MTISAQSQRIDLEAIACPVPAVEAYLTAFLDSQPLPANLRDAIAYALLGGGKQLRPILVIRCCEAVGGRAEQAMPAAAAVEMIHAFSLVHDDLPSLDDDELRRGRPTLHRHAGEAMAILAGDALMALAFELIATRLRPPALAGTIVVELATATNNMIVGQVYDTLPDFDDTVDPMQRLRTIHRNKTAALLRAACRMGAICGGADDVKIKAVSQYADAIGLMFQVVDDLLDVTQTTNQLGKVAGKDAEAGKLTYPGLLGVEASRHEVARLHRQATRSLRPFGPSAEAMQQLCDYLVVRQK